MSAVRVNRAELLQVLGRVAPGLAPRDTIEQASCFIFQDEWAATFNDEICCRAKTGLPAEIRGAVKAKPLLQVLENMAPPPGTPPDADGLDLRVANGELQLRAGRKRVGLRMEADIVLPVEQVDRPEGWVDLPEEFGPAIKQVSEAAGTNPEEFVTVCVHITPDFVEATDRWQACRYELKTGASRPFLVRARSIAHVPTLGLSRMGETDNWVHFRNRHLVFSCRRALDPYPDLTSSFAFRGARAVLPRGAAEAAALGAVFTAEDKDNNKVEVSLTPGGMVVRGSGAHGWAEHSLEMVYDGPPLAFRISPDMLTQLVKHHTNCELDGSKLRVDGERWCYINVLGRPAGTNAAAAPGPPPADDGAGDEESESAEDGE